MGYLLKDEANEYYTIGASEGGKKRKIQKKVLIKENLPKKKWKTVQNLIKFKEK